MSGRQNNSRQHSGNSHHLLPTWHDTAQSALARNDTSSSGSSSQVSGTSQVSQYPPQIPSTRRFVQSTNLRTSIYENLGLPTDTDDFALPEWSPPNDDKKAHRKQQQFNDYQPYDEKRQSVAFTVSSVKTNKDADRYMMNPNRQSMHSVHQSLQNELEDVQEVFDEEPPTGNTLKWKWSRPNRSQNVSSNPVLARRRLLCAIFLFIAVTSATSIGVSGVLIKRSITAFWFDGLSEDEQVTEDMLQTPADHVFALIVSISSFIVASMFAVTYMLQPTKIEDKVARTMASLLSFPRRAVGGLLFLVLLIGAWSAVTSLTTMSHITCVYLQKLDLSENMMVMVGFGRQMSLQDCRINDSLLAFAVIGMFEWLIAFAVVVDGHARRLSE